jgi:hypothetical protein
VTYIPSDYISWAPNKKYKGFDYRPPIIREKLQISIWKIDRFGVVKTKEKYFTPKDPSFNINSFNGFDIVSSLDGESILLQEKFMSGSSLIMVLNAFTLEVISEKRIIYNDGDIKPRKNEHIYEGDYLQGCVFPSDYEEPRFINWNKGK